MPAFLTILSAARAHWKLIGIGLLLMALAVQSVRLGHAKNEVERVKIANNELRAELKSISDSKNEQKAETEKRVEQADKGNKKADERARKIDTAPLAPDCKTPDIIMESNDL